MRRPLLALALLLPLPAWAAVPQFVSNGNSTVTASTGTCTPSTTTLGTVEGGDIVLLVVTGEHDRNAHALTTANGFVQIGSTVFGGDGDVTEEDPEIGMSVWWRRGFTSAPVVTDTGDHTSCALHKFRGAAISGDPWDVFATGNDSNANDTSANIPGSTTTVNDDLIVLIQGTSNNATSTANCGAVTNADLGTKTERFDSSNTSGLGGGHCIITAPKTSAGSYTTSTLTMGATTFKGAMSLALKPGMTHSTTNSTAANAFVTLTLIGATSTGSMNVVGCGNNGNRTVSSVTDSASNTYTQAASAAGSDGTHNSDVWYALSPTTGVTTVTCNFSGAADGTNKEIWVWEFPKQGNTWVFDLAAGINGTCASSADTGASVTTTHTEGFVVGVCITSNNITASPAAGNEFTFGGDIGATADGGASLLSTTAASHTPAWTDTCLPTTFGSSTAAFKREVAAGTCALSMALMGVGCR